MTVRSIAWALAALVTLASAASAGTINVQVENTMASDAFFFTPFWLSGHNGTFDTYDHGTLASTWPGLTPLAEEGDTGPLSDAFTKSPAGIAGGIQTTLAAVSGEGDAPVFSPGESASIVLDFGDSQVNRYLSFASMVIPSNDLFVGNDDPLAYELFDADGNFRGPLTIEIYGREVNDNGSEVNDAFGGAAFSANGGESVDEKVNIRDFFTQDGDVEYLESFVGTQTVTGVTIGSTFGAADLIGRITITATPSPGAAALLGVAGLFRRRRRTGLSAP